MQTPLALPPTESGTDCPEGDGENWKALKWENHFKFILFLFLLYFSFFVCVQCCFYSYLL